MRFNTSGNKGAAGPTGASGPTGPVGATGPQGTVGQTGPRGPSDIYATTLNTSPDVDISPTESTVLTLTLPAGDYLVEGQATLATKATADGAECFITQSNPSASSVDSETGYANIASPYFGATMTILAPFHVTSSSTLRLRCAGYQNTSTADPDVAAYATLSATAAAGLHVSGDGFSHAVAHRSK